jgi:hypothetical protein
MSKRTKQKKAKVTKVRGFGLSFMVILILLHGIVATILYSVLRTDTATIDRPWLITLMIWHSIMNIVAAAGIWYWQKWALWLYLISTGLALVAGILGIGIWSVFYMILPLAIVGWVLRSKWSYFGIE